MSVRTWVRFRPVQPPDRGPGNPAALAQARWRKELEQNPDVVGYAFEQPPGGPLQERQESRRDGVAPVDLSIAWTSIDAATRVLGNNALFEFLCGYVVGAPSTLVEGQVQHIEAPA